MSMPLDATLVLNSNSKLIRALGDAAEAGANEHSERVAKQVYTLALLAQRQLSAEELKNFLSGSFSRSAASSIWMTLMPSFSKSSTSSRMASASCWVCCSWGSAPLCAAIRR